MKKDNYFYIMIIAMSSIIGGAINYMYHPIMLKFMSIEDFGIFGSLVGIFNILAVFTTGISLFLNKEFSKNIKFKKKQKGLFFDSLKILSFLGIVSFVFFTLSAPLIANYLGISSVFLVGILGFSLIFIFPWMGIMALLKAIKYFEVISWSQILGPFIKLIGGVGLVFLGYNLYGAVYGFLLGLIIVFFFLLYFAIKYFKNIEYVSDMNRLLQDFSKNKKEILHFFFVSLFFAILMNADVIIVRNIFSAEEAGIYSGIAVLGKFLIFLLLSIETVYFGQIMEFSKEKVPNHLIRNPLILMLGSSIGALVINYFLGSFILGLLKSELAEYVNIYLLILVYYGFLAFISFFIKILIGWKKYAINYFLFVFIGILFSILYTFGKISLFDFALSFAVFGGMSSILFGIYFYFIYNKKPLKV
ncbi:oligosaccharide flippase family protein [Candidatus Gracilibacteria bacterium]|nr:oligosaccharide flippase family protein [Candidatus Gracilibacteria bacterium]